MRNSLRRFVPWFALVCLLGAASWVVVLLIARYQPTAGAVLLLSLLAAAFLPPARPELEQTAGAPPASVPGETSAHALDQLG
jgi:hypothetical protein